MNIIKSFVKGWFPYLIVSPFLSICSLFKRIVLTTINIFVIDIIIGYISFLDIVPHLINVISLIIIIYV